MNIIIANESQVNLHKLEEHVKAISNIHQNLSLIKPVCYITLTEKEMIDLNSNTLGHEYCTDIITFDYSEDTDFEYNEIYICPTHIKQNAETYQTTVEEEILRVAIHGLLHLSGLNDKTSEEQYKMTESENYYLKKIVSRENNF